MMVSDVTSRLHVNCIVLTVGIQCNLVSLLYDNVATFVTVQYPAGNLSDSEEDLLMFCRQSCDELPDPFIELEV